MLDHVEEQHEVEQPRGLGGRADHAGGEVGAEIGLAVVDVPADDLGPLGPCPAQLPGEPAVPRADVEDATWWHVAHVAFDQGAEEARPLGLPRVATLVSGPRGVVALARSTPG